MIKQKRILAVVPARGGSKGIPLKNIYPLKGESLIARVAKFIKDISIIDKAIVSTDHPKIAEEAIEHGLNSPFVRPKKISGDRVPDWDVLIHALEYMENIDNVIYDIVLLLQPTSPMRKKDEVVGAINMLIEKNCDAVWTVSETDSKSHPLKQLNILDSKISYYDPHGETIIARQDLEKIYHRNGVAYVITRECLKNNKSLMGNNTCAYICTQKHVSIDTLDDIKYIEYLLND